VKFLALISPKAWLALVLSVALAGGAWWLHHDGYTTGKTETMAAWNSERASIAAQSLKLDEQATRTTIDLQAKSDKKLKDKNEKIRALNTAIATVIASLSDRPNRPVEGSLPTPSGTGSAIGCTGAQLYRPDAEAFVGFAARAERIRIDLDQCQTQYESAKQAINKPSATN
jgi:hypothetical protein